MNKLLVIVALLGLLAITHCEDSGDKEKSAVKKGAEEFAKTDSGIRIQAKTGQRRQRNIVVSGVRGTGRLLRNVTSETASFVRRVGRATKKLATRVLGAVGKTTVDAANRLARRRGNGWRRKKKNSSPKVEPSKDEKKADPPTEG